MLIKPSILVDQMAGQAQHDVVFYVTKGSSGGNIQTCRQYVVPFNPNTALQIQTRNMFKDANNFFANAEDKTLGTVVFSKAEFLETLVHLARKLNYRGVPTTGPRAGAQTFIMAAIKYATSQDIWDWLAVLPQNMTTEQQLTDLKSNIDDAFELIKNEKQRERIGYVD